jgi:hypothetical protein
MTSVAHMSPCVESMCKGIWYDGASECSTDDAKHIDDGCSAGFSDSGDGVKTLIIFDWDDTLLPTSWLRQQDVLDCKVLSEEQQRQLEVLADVVEKTLRTALLFGKVVIVTNGQQGWVEASCAEAMPSLRHVLQQVRIVSARSTYEEEVDEPSEWKRLAFAHEVNQLAVQSDQQLNVISLGDSLHEQSAVMSIRGFVPNCFAKSLKFVETPTIEELIDQHEFVNMCFSDVAEHGDHLDVEIGAEKVA